MFELFLITGEISESEGSVASSASDVSSSSLRSRFLNVLRSNVESLRE